MMCFLLVSVVSACAGFLFAVLLLCAYDDRLTALDADEEERALMRKRRELMEEREYLDRN
jgi:hypothetical protein